MVTSIASLEEPGLTINRALDLLDAVEDKLKGILGALGAKFRDKIRDTLSRNPDLPVFRSVASVLVGNGGTLPLGLTPLDAANLKFCPLVSVDIERTFSSYKNMLTDRRLSLTKENISKIVVCQSFFNQQ